MSSRCVIKLRFSLQGVQNLTITLHKEKFFSSLWTKSALLNLTKGRWTWFYRHLSVMPEGKVAILFLEVARRSPWCRGTSAHVHWSLLHCPHSSGFSFVSPKRQRETNPSLPVLLFSHPPTRWTPPLRVGDFPTSSNSTTFPFVPAAPSGHRRRGRNVAPSRPLSSTALPPIRPLHHCRLLLRFSSTSNGNDPTRPTVARYYHSVLLAIYRPLSTTLPPNGVYRCCLPWLAKPHSQLRSAPGFSPPRDAPRHTLVNQRRWFWSSTSNWKPQNRACDAPAFSPRETAVTRQTHATMIFAHFRHDANRYWKHTRNGFISAYRGREVDICMELFNPEY